MTLYDFMKSSNNYDEEFVVHDVHYDIEVYFYLSDKDKNDWDESMENLAKILTVSSYYAQNNHLCAVVNLSQMIINSQLLLKKKGLFIDYNIDSIMDDIENILSGGVSASWLKEFVSVLSAANKSLKSMLIEAGYPESDMFHYGNDLYVYVTPLTTRILEEWCDIKGYDRECITQNGFLVNIFTDNVTDREMYDLAFQWYD